MRLFAVSKVLIPAAKRRGRLRTESRETSPPAVAEAVMAKSVTSLAVSSPSPMSNPTG
jgi:hypothetical protein